MKIGTLRTGFNTHRLKEGDPYHKKEIDFVKTINQDMSGNSRLLEQIVNSRDDRFYLSEEQEQIVLSVIQWLGTPVGQGFLDRVSKL